MQTPMCSCPRFLWTDPCKSIGFQPPYWKALNCCGWKTWMVQTSHRWILRSASVLAVSRKTCCTKSNKNCGLGDVRIWIESIRKQSKWVGQLISFCFAQTCQTSMHRFSCTAMQEHEKNHSSSKLRTVVLSEFRPIWNGWLSIRPRALYNHLWRSEVQSLAPRILVQFKFMAVPHHGNVMCGI